MEAARPLVVRPFVGEDIPFALEQIQREGWSSSAEVMSLHLRHDPEGCFVAEVMGARVGMVTTTAFRKSGWVGNLIVTPRARAMGVGTRLMEHAVRHLASRGHSTLRLEADPMGVNIYCRIGFVDELPSPRFALEEPPAATRSMAVLLDPGDLAAVASFDAPRFGDARGELLRGFLSLSTVALRVPARGRLAGYLMVQPFPGGTRLGPWVADSDGAAAELLRGAAAHLGRPLTVVALPGVNRAGIALLTACGFIPTPSSLRMVRGPRVAGGRAECVYGLASGAVG